MRSATEGGSTADIIRIETGAVELRPAYPPERKENNLSGKRGRGKGMIGEEASSLPHQSTIEGGGVKQMGQSRTQYDIASPGANRRVNCEGGQAAEGPQVSWVDPRSADLGKSSRNAVKTEIDDQPVELPRKVSSKKGGRRSS
ncbi:hypothetical protein CIHG_09124 [Coccidioides immitis H538.4]|uniref:Uncharacterized protein n=2 Tax=Coccidioides immitis TaxID=5501 RepID=A0A0J8S4T3_COCIT|nr:hypothetical protein CIRG_06559 [Coccidioides immitis RMSCC 2394]KMU91379.1 hypothetical protein CIHG_09124 [Coccidioides immitis H538.4]